MRRPILALALALAAGCGKSKQEEAMERLRDACFGFPAARATLSDIELQFQQSPSLIEFSTRFHPAGVQGCPFDDVTLLGRVLWRFPFTDGALCSPFGCAAWCEVWAVSNGQLTGEEVACGVRFSKGQP